MRSPRAASRPLLLVIAVVVVVALAGCVGAPLGDPASAEPSTDESPAAPSDEGAAVTTANGTLEVHYINVGQSVSTLVVGPDGETLLVDTGHYNDDGEHVIAYLQRHDVERIDHLVTSHNDADHIGGNGAIIDYYETEARGDNRLLRDGGRRGRRRLRPRDRGEHADLRRVPRRRRRTRRDAVRDARGRRDRLR